MNKINTVHLGLISYAEAQSLMLDLRSKRQKNLIPDTLLFLEHPPVITSGKRDAAADLKVSLTNLNEKGIQYQVSDRGGKLTYHGPGQLVIYFVIDIIKRQLSVDQLVCQSLKPIQTYLKSFGLESLYDHDNPGLWVGNQKIAAVGFHIQKGVTTHGISFNICNDLEVYDLFIPCGINNKRVTNLESLTQRQFRVVDVEQVLIPGYKTLF